MVSSIWAFHWFWLFLVSPFLFSLIFFWNREYFFHEKFMKAWTFLNWRAFLEFVNIFYVKLRIRDFFVFVNKFLKSWTFLKFTNIFPKFGNISWIREYFFSSLTSLYRIKLNNYTDKWITSTSSENKTNIICSVFVPRTRRSWRSTFFAREQRTGILRLDRLCLLMMNLDFSNVHTTTLALSQGYVERDGSRPLPESAAFICGSCCTNDDTVVYLCALKRIRTRGAEEDELRRLPSSRRRALG